MEQHRVANPTLLRSDGDLALVRRQDNRGSFLELAASSATLPRRGARLLEREYALRERLDASWAVRPIALTEERGRFALRLEDPDPGARLLSAEMGRPWPVVNFLPVAIALTAALRAAHASGLVHKDIRPPNVLLNAEMRRVWLTGFGLASLLPRERRFPEPPRLIEGSLQYMSPEQTGRMNRSVDSRSDLYALGVTFFEMLTGSLPFAASNPMGWLHCQIALEPPRAEERAVEVPAQLGAMVARLLEKSAEKRYQTAAGVEADLQRCLEALESSGRIEAFSLGGGDLPDQLLIPETLYGREAEVSELVAAFERVVKEGTLGVVLVSGYSGIGKSSVVNELHKSLVPPRGVFVAGKFDQYRRDIPYSTLAQALRQLVRMILVEDDAEVVSWRAELTAALGPNAAVMTALIPELERIIGPAPPVPELGPKEAQNRFQLVFRDFIRVFASAAHPLALFLDDLQWIDPATLQLIESLAGERGSLRLLLIGAYRSNEVDAAHPLTPVLRAVRSSGVRLNELVLDALESASVEQLVADALHAERPQTEPLARVIYEKAGGNPFFTIEFLTELVYEQLLTLDASTSTWNWDRPAIEARGYKDNVVELMATKLVRLPPATQAALRDLSCLGNHATVTTLAHVHARTVEEVDAALWHAVRSGVVLRRGSDYAFVHDRVHEAAYSLIPEAERVDSHLRIGRLLLACVTSETPPEAVFTVVSQFTPAVACVTDPLERAKLRGLNVRAGKMAKRSIAYASARTYLDTSAALSNDDAWTTDYHATFELYLLLAECEFLVGNFDVAERHFEVLLERAVNRTDKADVYGVRLQLYQVAGRYTQGLSLARHALRLFDIDIPETAAEIQKATDAACNAVWINLGGRDIASLVDAPATEEPSLPALMKILVNAGPCAFNGGPHLYPLITVTGVNLSLRLGHTKWSAFSYCAYAVVLVAIFKDIASGAAFAETALLLNEKLGNAALQGSISLVHCHFVVFWKKPFAAVLPLQEKSLIACLETGDLAYACFNRYFAVWHLIETGLPLDEVQLRSKDYAAVCRQANNDALYQLVVLERQFVACLRGNTNDPLGLSDTSFDEQQSFAAVVAATYGAGIVLYHVMKQILAFLHGQYRESLESAKAAEPFLGSAMSTAIEAAFFLHRGLATAAVLESAGDAERQQHDDVLADAEARYEIWARECPENFSGRQALLLAEIARAHGRAEVAETHYAAAIHRARTNGLVQDEAVASELAAHFYERRGLETSARAHYLDARDAYGRWGANAKVHQLERQHPLLLAARDEAIGAVNFGAAVELLDLATVVRVLQALTSEIVLDDVVERLLTIALENAGAQRGLLLDAGAAPLSVATAEAGGVVVRHVGRDSALPSYPSSIVRYVARTREPVVLDDASTHNHFAANANVGRALRSVLCLPLIKQGAVVGVLYLENNLAPCVFTPSRAALMKLVASQAAISIENARLHASLREENESRRRVEAYLAEAQRLSRTGSFGWDVTTGALTWSEETFRIMGFDAVSKPALADALERVHPEDLAIVRAKLADATRAGGGLEVEHRIQLPDGATRTVSVVGRPLRDSAGRVEYVGALRDITEQRASEAALTQARDDLTRVMRATALGELAASIAHEVNQPLTAIATNAMTARRVLAATPPKLDRASSALQAIAADSVRAGEIIRGIRSFLTRSPMTLVPCSVNGVVGDVFRLVRGQLQKARVTLETILEESLPDVLGDTIQLQQVLLNLTLNALDACKDLSQERRRVIVRSFTERGAERPWVVVSVRDGGRGIEPDAEARLFDAFYTTKSSGLGMGLSISRSIIERHEGQLTASRNDDYGATFSVRLPAVG